MKQKPKPLKPLALAESATIITATITLFASFLALIEPSIRTITPLIQALYAPLGYTLNIPGILLGTLYIAIDTFLITYAFAWIYNKLL